MTERRSTQGSGGRQSRKALAVQGEGVVKIWVMWKSPTQLTLQHSHEQIVTFNMEENGTVEAVLSVCVRKVFDC